MAEIVDVVDLDDRVVDQASKEKCHRKGLFHRGVSILVFRSEDRQELLIQERSSEVAIKPEHMGLTGGHVKAGESYREAAERELEEELHGSSSQEVELEELFKLKNTLDDDSQFVKVFRAVDSGPFNLLDKEVREIRFKDFEALVEQVKNEPEKFTAISRLVIEEYQERCR